MKHLILLVTIASFLSCKREKKMKEQSIPVTDTTTSTDTSKGLGSTNSFAELNVSTNNIILTGLNEVRLLSIYKIPINQDKNILYDEGTSYSNNDISNEDDYKYYMPGIDIIKGYNLVNIGHYNVEKDSLSYFFKKPVLIKTLYFPGVRRDSLKGQEIKRDFFLVTAYTGDTNKDGFINNKDFRRFFYIDKLNQSQVSLLPQDYSAIRSSYDYRNDFMYIYARKDADKNGILEIKEPVSIFLLNLKIPTVLKRIF